MATGRTHPKYVRFYMDGYDLSGYSRSVGTLLWSYEEADLTVLLSDAVKGYLPNHAMLGIGPLNGVFDNTATSGLHVIASSVQSERVVMIPVGIRAAPAVGDPAYMGQFVQLDYQATDEAPIVTATIPFGQWEAANMIYYHKPWGNLLHAKGAETGANASGTGVDQFGASSALGGFMCWQVFAGDGTATITTQHSVDEVDGNYANLGGCTTGEIDFSSVSSGIAATTANTTTVNRYLRWQISLNTATTVTFALAFVRAGV